MKKLFGYIALFILACTLTSFVMHKYYVSVFQLDYSPEKKRIEVIARVFVDDLEKALDSHYNKKTYMDTSQEIPQATTYIKNYFSDNIKLKINGQAQKLKYITRELDDDTEVLYFTVPAPEKVKTLWMENKILFELFNEQQNIIHTRVDDQKKSLLLTTGTPSGTVEF
ncbi:DUF6702 family protein [Flavobacterium rhizosphaerae]|uniref:DUF6702 family protein n=1 Tax=Flavobacterium rhizosphaerae TaxID=3163298 RepID=A0ABW8Z2E4_9FLAO